MNSNQTDGFKDLIEQPSYSETIFRRIEIKEDDDWSRRHVEITEVFHYRYGEKSVVMRHHKEEKWEWQDK